jgi:hypothetical protein
MPCSISSRTASSTPVRRTAVVAALAVIAATAIVTWQPSGQLPASVAELRLIADVSPFVQASGARAQQDLRAR